MACLSEHSVQKVMANKNFLARGVQRAQEPDGTPKLTEPRVVTFGFKHFKIVKKMTTSGKRNVARVEVCLLSHVEQLLDSFGRNQLFDLFQ